MFKPFNFFIRKFIYQVFEGVTESVLDNIDIGKIDPSDEVFIYFILELIIGSLLELKQGSQVVTYHNLTQLAKDIIYKKERHKRKRKNKNVADYI